MPRPIPPQFAQAPAFTSKIGLSRLTLDLQITTLYYGGGVEGGVADPLTPYRPSAIRGALRWFWRATRGAACANWVDLLAQESAIWGATDHASPITVEVANGRLGQPVIAKRQENGRWISEEPIYALFPAQSTEIRTLHRRGSFQLILTYPEKFTADIEAALRALITFGGMGARTRRGLGALYCKEFPGVETVRPADLTGDGALRDWATLKGARLLVGQPTTWDAAWLTAVGALKSFRQLRNPGSEPNRPGRSRWPEPDAIRRLRKQASPRHSQPIHKDNIFPRAAFGLPIIFHFKDHGEPGDNTLVIDAHTDRMASPIILKPVAISDRQAVPVCLALNVAKPTKLILQQKDRPDIPVPVGPLDAIPGLLQTVQKLFGAAQVRRL